MKFVASDTILLKPNGVHIYTMKREYKEIIVLMVLPLTVMAATSSFP